MYHPEARLRRHSFAQSDQHFLLCASPKTVNSQNFLLCVSPKTDNSGKTIGIAGGSSLEELNRPEVYLFLAQKLQPVPWDGCDSARTRHMFLMFSSCESMSNTAMSSA